MNSLCRRAVALCVTLLAALLTACASKAPAPVSERGAAAGPQASASTAAAKDLYTVKKGDTLYSIALENGLDHRELAAWNNIENPNRIRVGQQLRVKPPQSASLTSSDGVVTQPIGGSQAVEQRPLDSTPAAATTSGTAQFKTEPKAGKVPYSEEALAREQRAAELGAVAKAEAKPEARPEPKPEPKSAAAAETAAGVDEVGWIWPSSGKLIAQFSESGSKGVDIGGKAGDPVVAAADGKVVYAGTGLRGYGKLLIIKHNETFLSAYAHNRKLLVEDKQSVRKGQKIAEMGDTDADQVKLHFEVRRQGKPVDPLKYLPQR